MRPLFAEVWDVKDADQRDEPLIGHVHLGDGGAPSRVRSVVVPHFVQSNTLELDMSLQWRTLINLHLVGRSQLHAEQASDLRKILERGAKKL